MRKPVSNVVLTDKHREALSRWSAATGESKSHAIRAALNAWQPIQSLLQPTPIDAPSQDRAA
jgi:hypothetical protein